MVLPETKANQSQCRLYGLEVTFQDFDQSDSLAVYEYWRLIHQQPYRPIDEIFQWEPKEPLKGRTSNATTKSIQSISESGL